MSRLLTLDLGNTALSGGIWEGDTLVEEWTSTFSPQSLSSRLALFQQKNKIDGAILASVVPQQTGSILDICKKILGTKCCELGINIDTGLKILYRQPEKVGADRIANAVGAFHVYGGPVIVVDFGTAITFDVVSKDYEYLGGVIAPGIKISTQALFANAALLPEVKITIPDNVLGRDTESSIQSGVYWGTLGLVELIIRKLKRELGWGRETRLVATGGYSQLILRRSRVIKYIDPFLTLRGLQIIAKSIAPPK